MTVYIRNVPVTRNSTANLRVSIHDTITYADDATGHMSAAELSKTRQKQILVLARRARKHGQEIVDWTAL